MARTNREKLLTRLTPRSRFRWMLSCRYYPNHQRRDLLSYLREVPDRTASLDECVGYLMEREEERIGERPGHDQVETALHHIHMPKLADSGVLEYDARCQQLHYCGEDRLEDWHDHIQSK